MPAPRTKGPSRWFGSVWRALRAQWAGAKEATPLLGECTSDFTLDLPHGIFDDLCKRVNESGRRIYEFHGERAILLSSGMHFDCFLLSSGKIRASGDEPPSITHSLAYESLVLGARRDELLLTLLPTRPAAALECERCAGKRYCALWPESSVPGASELTVICDECHGLGWNVETPAL